MPDPDGSGDMFAAPPRRRRKKRSPYPTTADGKNPWPAIHRERVAEAKKLGLPPPMPPPEAGVPRDDIY